MAGERAKTYPRDEVREVATDLAAKDFLRKGPPMQRRAVAEIGSVAKRTHVQLAGRHRSGRNRSVVTGSDQFLAETVGWKLKDLHDATVGALLGSHYMSRSLGVVQSALQRAGSRDRAAVADIARDVFGAVFDGTVNNRHRFGGLRGRMALWSIFGDDPDTRAALADKYTADTNSVLDGYALAAERLGRRINVNDEVERRALIEFVDVVTACLDGMVHRAAVDGDRERWARLFSEFFGDTAFAFIERDERTRPSPAG